LFANSLIPAVVQKILDEAVAVAVFSSDDFLLRLCTRSILLGLGIFFKIPQESSLQGNASFWTIPLGKAVLDNPTAATKNLLCDVSVARMSSAKRVTSR